MRNLAAKVPEDIWPELKARIQAVYQAPNRAIARDLAKGVIVDFGKDLPSAIACLEDDFEACIAHLRMPVTHRRAIRPLRQGAPPPQVLPNTWGERPVNKLMFSAMTRAAECWRAIRLTDFDRRQIAAARKELDAEYTAADTSPSASQQGGHATEIFQQFPDLTPSHFFFRGLGLLVPASKILAAAGSCQGPRRNRRRAAPS